MKSNVFLFIKCNEKHLSKQGLPITYTLEKSVFTGATFKGLWVVSFQASEKACGILGLFESSLNF